MQITKGIDKFMMIDINANEMSNIYDAFQNARAQMQILVNMQDDEFIKILAVKKQGVPELRKIIKTKIEFYEKFLKKISSYMTKPQ